MDDITLLFGIPAFFTCIGAMFQVKIWYKLGELDNCKNKDCCNYGRGG